MLVGVFRTIFDMSNVQAALVQFAYYGAYFTLAIPAAIINRRFGYKAGVLSGLGLASVGGLLFIPASEILVYEVFLIALFVLAAGLSILETSANPFVIAMGPEGSATQRLNLAQAFNPVGANIGVLLGAVLILPQITSETEKTIMSPAELETSQEEDLALVLGPYLGIACVLILIWLLIAFRKMSTPAEAVQEEEGGRSGAAWAGCGATATTATAWRRSSSMSRPRSAPGRSRSSMRRTSSGCRGGLGLVPAGQPDPVPGRPLPDDLAARDLPAPPCCCSSWPRSGSASAWWRCSRRTWWG